MVPAREQTDYNYEEGLAVGLSATDRSKNGAVQATGYPLEVSRDPNWPGLSARAGRFAADPDTMDALADDLLKEAEFVQQVPQRLAAEAVGVRFGPEQWSAASSLTSANRIVADAIRRYTEEMVKTMTEAATAVKKAAAHIRESDGQNRGNASHVESNMGGGPITEWT